MNMKKELRLLYGIQKMRQAGLDYEEWGEIIRTAKMKLLARLMRAEIKALKSSLWRR